MVHRSHSQGTGLGRGLLRCESQSCSLWQLFFPFCGSGMLLGLWWRPWTTYQTITQGTYAYTLHSVSAGPWGQEACRLCREPFPARGPPRASRRLRGPPWGASSETVGVAPPPPTGAAPMAFLSGPRDSLEIGFGPFPSGDKALSLEEEGLGFSLFCASYSPCDLEQVTAQFWASLSLQSRNNNSCPVYLTEYKSKELTDVEVLHKVKNMTPIWGVINNH